MAAISLTLPESRRSSAPIKWIKGLVASFRWAIDVRRRCDRFEATGRRLDGDAIRRIAEEASTAADRA